VQYAIERGRISKDPKSGLINVEEADIAWEKTGGKPRKQRSGEDEQKAASTRRATWAKKQQAEAPVIQVDAVGEHPAASVRSSYNESRSAREFYDAEIKRLELEQKKGKLVDAQKVYDEAFNTYRAYRDAMLNIPDRIASQIATETDARVVHDLLIEEIRKTLDAFIKSRAA